jgi:hypothetical protein
VLEGLTGSKVSSSARSVRQVFGFAGVTCTPLAWV